MNLRALQSMGRELEKLAGPPPYQQGLSSAPRPDPGQRFTIPAGQGIRDVAPPPDNLVTRSFKDNPGKALSWAVLPLVPTTPMQALAVGLDELTSNRPYVDPLKNPKSLAYMRAHQQPVVPDLDAGMPPRPAPTRTLASFARPPRPAAPVNAPAPSPVSTPVASPATNPTPQPRRFAPGYTPLGAGAQGINLR